MGIDVEDLQKRVNVIQARVADAQLKDSLKGINNDVRALAQERDDERNRLQTTVNQNLATITQLQVSVANLQQTNADQLKTIADLKKKLETTAPAVSSVTPLSLANSFKSVIDTIQTQARQTPGVATTIKSMDLEVKGLVQVQADKSTLLVMPTPGSSIDPNSLSTLRVSFAAVPVAAAAADLGTKGPSIIGGPESVPSSRRAPAAAKKKRTATSKRRRAGTK